MPMDVVELTQRLVRVPSVNPMGHRVDQPDIQLEHRMADLLESIFQEWGLAYERSEVAPGRDNIVASLPGNSGKTIVPGGPPRYRSGRWDDGRTVRWAGNQ